MAAGRNTSPVV